MTNLECFALTDEARKSGVDAEDWDALLKWISETKGEDVARDFEIRCQDPM